MARRKKKKRRARSFTIPMAVVLPVVSPMLEGNVISYVQSGNFGGAVDSLNKRYGFADMNLSIATYSKILFGLAVHWAASKFGLNRALGRAGVPLIRI